MAITFPTSPASGDIVTADGIELVYEEEKNRWSTYRVENSGSLPSRSPRFVPPPALTPSGLGAAFKGGYYIGNIQGYYLIAAPIEGETTAQYKTSNTDTPGQTFEGYNGSIITTAMINNDPNAHPAAKFCSELTIGGYTDWYFPAQIEVLTMYNNRNYMPEGHKFSSATAVKYWTSTKRGNLDAWAYYFGNPYAGQQSGTYKTASHLVRAVRRVLIPT